MPPNPVEGYHGGSVQLLETTSVNSTALKTTSKAKKGRFSGPVSYVKKYSGIKAYLDNIRTEKTVTKQVQEMEFVPPSETAEQAERRMRQKNARQENREIINEKMRMERKLVKKEIRLLLLSILQNPKVAAAAISILRGKDLVGAFQIAWSYLYSIASEYYMRFKKSPSREWLEAEVDSYRVDFKESFTDYELKEIKTILGRMRPRKLRSQADYQVALSYIRRAAYASAYREYKEDKDHDALVRKVNKISQIGEETRTISLVDVQAQEMSWLWEFYIPRGMISIIDGDPGTGKSFLTCDLTARVTRGWAMPPCSDRTPVTKPGAVLLINFEDDLARTIKPRILDAGGDTRLVRMLDLKTPDGTERIPTFPDDLPELERIIKKYRIKLVIIDPLMAALNNVKVDSYKDSSIRSLLAQVKLVAENTECAFLFVRHLTKDGKEKNPIYRGGGSIGISGACRSGFLLAKHPQNDRVRVLASTKTNLEKDPASLAFTIEDKKVTWSGEEQLTASDLVRGCTDKGRPPNEVQAATDWLASYLENGARQAKKLKNNALKAGHKLRTLERAKSNMKIVSSLRKKKWFWQLPQCEPD
jgi:archaellum biogenesis ATPase FlaH